MNGVLTQPLPRQRHQWTRETAREAWRKSVESRQRAAEALRRAQEQPPEPPPPRVEHERTALVREQITLTRNALLSTKLEANERANLIRALDLMLDRERVLAGEPLPGSRKPGPQSSRPAPPQFPPPTLVETPEPPELPPTQTTDNHKVA